MDYQKEYTIERCSPRLKTHIRRKDLLIQLVKRDILSRYKGSYLGFIWTLITPMFMLSIYTFVFGIVFKARWQDRSASMVTATGAAGLVQFALVIYCGLIIYDIFSITINRSSSIIHENPNYVKKISFPLALLPCSAFCSTVFHGLINLAILLVVSLVAMHTVSWHIVLMPLVFIPLTLLTLGLAWTMAALGVFIRDISIGVGLFMQVLFFMTPIFYSVELVPEHLRWILYINPLTVIVESSRDFLIWGTFPAWNELGLATLASGVIAWLGYAFFSKSKKFFADVL